MPQKTNLNVSPYYDDFDKDSNFYKVLFKPGFPVQARELSTLQSILQNQVESFGNHVFKEGSVVIPGNITFDGEYPSVKINSQHLGIDVLAYADELIGKKIKGETSGITAVVDKYLPISDENGITDLTLFVKYKKAGNNNEVSAFEDGEILNADESFTYGNTVINKGEGIASLIEKDATAVGSAASIEQGVFFIKGSFVDVAADQIVLDAYTNKSNYRVGLIVNETIITSKDDESLYDNAKGFSNYAAPGADRLKIHTVLSKKSLEDVENKNFIELLRIEGGQIKKVQKKPVYNVIKDYFAERTFDESGDYIVKKFDVEVKESLNDRLSNGGVYFEGQSTTEGNTPAEFLMAVSISPGKGYVRGYDIETSDTKVIDIGKPRDTETIESSPVPFDFGTLLRVNHVQGTPFFGLTKNTNVVKLQNERRGSSDSAATGTEIGQARVYNFGLTDSRYEDLSSSWNLYLFDIQTYTTLTLNENTTNTQIPLSSYIKGVSSGATGYVQSAPGGSTSITLMQTSGQFMVGEPLLINGTKEVSRTIEAVTAYNIEDVKSVYQDSTAVDSGLKKDFIADVILKREVLRGLDSGTVVQIATSGAMTAPGITFNNIKVGDIIRYQIGGVTDETFNRVSAINATKTEVTLATVTSRSGVCDGDLPSSNFVGAVRIGKPTVFEKGGLFSKLEETNVSSVNLNKSNLILSNQVREQSTDANGELTLNITATGISSSRFESFDTERYSIHYNDGTIEDLSEDQFTLSASGNSITFKGLTTDQSSNVTVNTTLKKFNVQNKSKVLTRSEKINVTKTVSAASTEVSGLDVGSFYGTRIEDEEISLNFPDVVNIVAVYESKDKGTPSLDSLEFPSGLSLDTESILGEKVIGQDSNAIAQIVTRSSATKVEIVYLNSAEFIKGENVVFEESEITAPLQVINDGNYQDVTDKFDLDKGIKDQFYDYSRIIRKNTGYIPSKRLLIIHNHYTVPSNDNGDVYTVNSYTDERFKSDIATVDGLRVSDTIDFRPRVAEFTSTTLSPFDFASRNFETAGNNPPHLVAPKETSLVGLSYYLPRTDIVVLSKFGVFQVIEGVSSKNPVTPTTTSESMLIATIKHPAYLYNTEDSVIIFQDNKRYTMKDIGKLEDRIENLEDLTSLSLLELDTKTLQVKDADGLDRFKSGFFVDDFSDNTRIDSRLSTNSVTNNTLICPIDFWSLKPRVALDPSETSEDYSLDLPLFDPQIQKTGDLLTLKYDEKEWISNKQASRIENVNPFNVVKFAGQIKLDPASDVWVRTVYTDGGTRSVNGDKEDSFVTEVKTSTEPDTHIRSRNVAFTATSLRPSTRYYHFFDKSTNLDIIPKLLEITMSSGVFEKGETVKGFIKGVERFSARIAQPNHRKGNLSNPTATFKFNPYDTSLELSKEYSASSTILNIDVLGLSDEVLGKFSGYVTKGMKLVGETSGAEAEVSKIRLISDELGILMGSFFFRDPLRNPRPPVTFTTGLKEFKLTSSKTNGENVPGDLSISSARTIYNTGGIVETFNRTTVTVRVPPPPPPPPPPIIINNTIVRREIVERTTRERVIVEREPRPEPRDPLAQSFTCDETGAFLTAVDVYFKKKDPVESVTVEIRTVELGTPTNQLIQDYARVILEPEQVKVSDDASVPTKVVFESPIYLQPNVEYSVVLLAPTSNNYEAWISRTGEASISSKDLPDAESAIISTQYINGSLFKSQNGTIWTPSQFEDLKFTLYKASFSTTPGTAYFYNPDLDVNNTNVPRLIKDGVKTLPRKLKVGIDTTSVMDSILQIGRKVSDSTNSTAISGNIEQVGGKINTSSGVTASNTGIGYSNGTFTEVPLFSITGSGSGAEATVVISGGEINGNPTITKSGNGYVVGDILGITTSNVGKGRNGTVSVTNLDGFDTLYLTNVQGEEFTTGQDLVVYNGNTAVAYANTNITSSSLISTLYDGRVVEITQFNHALHADNNFVKFANIEPSTIPTKLTTALGLSDTTISVANTTTFGNFEGISTSRGYVQINQEIIYYDSITAGSGNAGTLGIGTRGVDGSLKSSHEIDSQAFAYELNGISLHRINTKHEMPTDSTLVSKKDFDTYHVQIGRDDRDSGDSMLCFTDENTLGGVNAFASQNYQFNQITPEFNTLTPGEGTGISAQLRTVSGTSAGGSELSFIDQGLQNISLNDSTDMTTPRLVASRVNETERLTDLPSNKSLTLALTMFTTDPNLSPIIDSSTAAIILGRSRLNNPISDYSNDGRVNSINDDPHIARYVTQKISLKQPASSLKVFIASERDLTSDFRVLYELFTAGSNGVEQSFELFPGFDNLTDTDGDGFGDEVIDVTLNNGRPDAKIEPSSADEFKEYQFSADNIPEFTAFRIKLVCSGTNEAKAPRFKDIRIIALA